MLEHSPTPEKSLPTHAIPLRTLPVASSRPELRRLEAFFVRYRDHMAWLHIALFVLFVGLIFLPVLIPHPPEDASPLTHFTPLANYVLWGLWFPLILLSVLFSGRSWCGLLCPMGAASEWLNHKGPQRPIPAWLRWPGTPVISFLTVTVLGQTVGVRDYPEAIAEIFGAILLLALWIGWRYGRHKRAWCRHLCPIGLLLGIFSRLGAVQFVPKQPQAGADNYTEKGLCPTMIDINRKRASRHCIACFRCVNPKAKGGLFLRLRRFGDEIERIHQHQANNTEVWFLFLATGIALGGFLWLSAPLYQELRQTAGAWFIERDAFWVAMPGPAWLMSVHPERREVFTWLDFGMISGFMLGCMLAFSAILTLTTALSAYISGVLGGRRDFRTRFFELGYMYAPIAMLSLVIGLGGELFSPLLQLGMTPQHVGLIKAILLLGAWLWSVALGARIIRYQSVPLSLHWLPLLPGSLGCLVILMAWWPSISI